jgi:hypothetical protein
MHATSFSHLNLCVHTHFQDILAELYDPKTRRQVEERQKTQVCENFFGMREFEIFNGSFTYVRTGHTVYAHVHTCIHTLTKSRSLLPLDHPQYVNPESKGHGPKFGAPP